MTDYFGIGNAVKSGVRIYFQSARRTGRTISMLDHLQDGDRVIFADKKEADRVKRLFQEDGKNVECIVVEPRNLDKLLRHGTNQKRTIFEHSWVEQYYLSAIERCEKDINHFQTQLSGGGEPHRKQKEKLSN